MSEKTKKRICGSVSLLLVIILLPMMLLSSVIVDTARINMARSMVSSAGDLTMNSALANYDTILKDVYGLFAMSQISNKTDDELAAELQKYFEKTLVSYGVTTEAEAGEYVQFLIGDFKDIVSGVSEQGMGNFLSMSVPEGTFNAKKITNSALSNPDILRKQIVEYMKYRAPMEFGLSFLDSIKAFKSVEKQNEVVESQVQAQESIQDVSSACKTLIDEIRKYDKNLDIINGVTVVNSDTAPTTVQGYDNPSDGKTVPLKDYALPINVQKKDANSQVDKYMAVWGDNYNYSYINKIAMIFALNPVDISDKYLYEMNAAPTNTINQSEYFIPIQDKINYSSSGIDVEVNLAGDTDSAKTQVLNQISNLNSNYKKTADSYHNKDFLPEDYISLDRKSFQNEASAINTFLAYQRFMTNDSASTIKYSDVEPIFEELCKLGEYFANFEEYIDKDIEKEEGEYQEAKEKSDDAAGKADVYQGRIEGAIKDFNNANKNANFKCDFLSEAQISTLTKLLEKTYTLPQTFTLGGKTFYDYYSFSIGSNYVTFFKNIANSYNTAMCKEALAYINATDSVSSSSFRRHMERNVKGFSDKDDFYSLFDYLVTMISYQDTMRENIGQYNEIRKQYSDLKDEESTQKNEWEAVKNEKETVKRQFNSCIGNFRPFSQRYQTNMSKYLEYQVTAQNVVATKASKIAEQFTKIKNNVKCIIDQLKAIETAASNTKTAITAYNAKLDAWSQKNNSYVSENSADSFSKQNAADIEASKTQYDLNSLETLSTYVTSIRVEYEEFYQRLTDDVCLKYGSKKIDTIKSCGDVISAIPETIKSVAPTIVDSNFASSKFGLIYSSNEVTGLEIEQQSYFLQPSALPIQFLKYLNENYPVSSSPESTGIEQTKQDNAEEEYDSVKASLKSSSSVDKLPTTSSSGEGGGEGGGTKTSDFGYSYKSYDAGQMSGLPSEGAGTKSASSDVYKMSEKDGKVDASSSVTSQKNGLSSVLGNIGKVANAGLENLYILNYLFENFSYNTIVQETILEGESANTSDSPWASLAEAEAQLTAENVEKWQEEIRMLSGYLKNSTNNYLYGAELEYILFGSKDIPKNVTYTKGSIYAIRFAFNSIYAFTNSEIKATTMSAGLAVQAATLGVVPYKVVQIVLQLALAAGESAYDLNLISNGLKVAVVKTTDTWALSPSGALKGAAEYAAGKATDVVVNTANKLINSTAGSLQQLVDSTAENLSSNAEALATELEDATWAKIEELVDTVFTFVQSRIEEELHIIQYAEYIDRETGQTLTTVKEQIDEAFLGLRNTLAIEIEERFGSSKIGAKVVPLIVLQMDSFLNEFEEKVEAAIPNAEDVSATQVIVSKMNSIKMSLANMVRDRLTVIKNEATKFVSEFVDGVADELKNCIGEGAEKLSEEATKKLKEEASNITNRFVNEYLSEGVDASVGGDLDNMAGGSNKSVASIIRFGYKDYLMLITFIDICVNDDNVLKRTGDLIQLNLANAKGANDGKTFSHGSDNFKLTNANTYVEINAEVELDMLLMNLDLFARSVNDNTEVEGEFSPTVSIVYKGLYGY